MTERISSRQFHEADGVDDWRVVFSGACTYFRTGSFRAGVALVDVISELAEAAHHHPDIDLRYPGVTVRLTTHDVGGLSSRDVGLAQQISAAARELGIAADPSAVQTVQVSIDAASPGRVMPFWRAVLGYRVLGDEDLADPRASGPSFWFQEVDALQPGRNRFHIDVSVPQDQGQARVAAAIAAGGHLVSDEHAPDWWTLADPDGNEADVAIWMDSEGASLRFQFAGVATGRPARRVLTRACTARTASVTPMMAPRTEPASTMSHRPALMPTLCWNSSVISPNAKPAP
jgi:4a-hydroxytetrahydrobiopterin dehydratase